MHHRHHGMIGQRDRRTLMSQPSRIGSSPLRWTQILILGLTVLYSIRSKYHPTDLLEEQFRKEREETRREVLQKRSIGKATPDDSQSESLQLQPLVHSKSAQGDHHNFLFHADNPSTTLWQQLPDWAASYFEWHATQRVVAATSTRFLLYDPYEDQFLSFYDVLWLASQTKRLLLIQHQQWLEPASLLDWKIPRTTKQWPTQPVSPYHNIRDDPSRSVLVHHVLPDMEAPHQHRHERRRAVRAVWKALFRPRPELQDHVATVIQERLENRPYTAILWSSNNNEASSLLRTVHCAHWLWEQAHRHDTQPMVYLITNHTIPRDVAPLVVADNNNNHDNMLQLLVHTYVAAGADCLVYAGLSSTVATRLSETSCRWRYDGGSIQCPVSQ